MLALPFSYMLWSYQSCCFEINWSSYFKNYYTQSKKPYVIWVLIFVNVGCDKMLQKNNANERFIHMTLVGVRTFFFPNNEILH